MFKLSATLIGHEKDVRDITIGKDNAVITASRDGTVKAWESDHAYLVPRTIFTSPSGAFINAIACNTSSANTMVAAAGNDAIIYVSELIDSSDAPIDDTGLFQLIGHSANICALDYSHSELVLSSWDQTAKVWDLDTCAVKYNLVGHESSVWDAKALGNQEYITCSADRTIKLWKCDQVVATLSGHNDVVRKLLVLPNRQFASALNDGTIKLWDMDSRSLVKTLSGHSSFVYDLARLSNGDIVSASEDRTIRIWRDGTAVQVITLPCISVWAVTAFPNDDIVAGGSDYTARVFTRDESRSASAEELDAFKTSVETSSISELSLDDLKKSDLPGPEALQLQGKNEGQILVVKSATGVIEAHQWLNSQWVKVGDVVGQALSNTKKFLDGKEWDYVFDVDIEDGKPALKLPYNSNENPYAAAERFLAQHELPQLYCEEVVRFIAKNTEGVSLDSTQSAINPYADVHEAKVATLPILTYIQFLDFNISQLEKGLRKLNALVPMPNQFTDAQISDALTALSNINSQAAKHLIQDFCQPIIEDWPAQSKLIGFDILKAAVPKLITVDLVQTDMALIIDKAVATGLSDIDESTIPLFMLILKTVANFFKSVLFVQLYVDPSDDGQHYTFSENFVSLLTSLETILMMNSSSLDGKSNKQYVPMLSALSTLIFNVSVMINTTPQFSSPQTAVPVLTFIQACSNELIEGSSELAYRVLVAYGNLLHSGHATITPLWWPVALALYGEESRFRDLDADYKILCKQ